MKWFPIVLLVLFVSCKRETQDKVRVAGLNRQISASQVRITESLFSDEQFQFEQWMNKTYYALRHEGLSNKKTWLQIDSLTRARYKGALPPWYQILKQESDSLMKEKTRYKRVRLV